MQFHLLQGITEGKKGKKVDSKWEWVERCDCTLAYVKESVVVQLRGSKIHLQHYNAALSQALKVHPRVPLFLAEMIIHWLWDGPSSLKKSAQPEAQLGREAFVCLSSQRVTISLPLLLLAVHFSFPFPPLSCLFLLLACNSGGAQCWTSFLAKAAGLWVPHLFLTQLNDRHSDTQVAHTLLFALLSHRETETWPQNWAILTFWINGISCASPSFNCIPSFHFSPFTLFHSAATGLSVQPPGLLSGLLSRPAMMFMLSNFSFLGKGEVEEKWPPWNPVPWVLLSTDSAVTEREWPHWHFAVGQSSSRTGCILAAGFIPWWGSSPPLPPPPSQSLP